MMVDEDRSGGDGSGADSSRRDPDQIIQESKAILKRLLQGFDELEEVIKETREDAQKGRGGSSRWGL